MSSTRILINELKNQLKARGLRYCDIAEHLKLSEGSVKRLLAEGNQISLERLESICSLLDLDMSELFKLAYSKDSTLTSLTLKQEQRLINDKRLLLVAICVINGYQFQQIVQQYQFTKAELIQRLAELDRLNIIELLPENKIRLRISPSFRWQHGGPIQAFFQQQVKEAFFNSDFSGSDEELVMATGLMSIPTNRKMQQKLLKVVEDFYLSCQSDESLTIDEKHGTSLIVAIRKWTLPLFRDIEHKHNE